MRTKTFYPFYEKRIAQIIDKTRKAIYPMEILGSTVWSDLNDILYEILHKISVRTLIAEMHKYLEKEGISDSTKKEEYLAYVDLLNRADYREDILGRYKGLADLLETIGENQYQFWSEFLVRLKKDWPFLNKLAGDEGTTLYVKAIKANVSDSHRKGRMVIRITISDGSHFFYKPHGMENEIFLQDLIDKICKDHGWKRRRQRIFDKGTYGWAEEIPHSPCDCEREVSCFYQKSGMLAAVSYVLGIGDLHYENVIANRDDPVIIDAETLFQNMSPVYRWDENAFYSVLSSGLFPGGIVGKNMSGIMGGEEKPYGREVPVLLNDQTSEMRIGYKKPRLKKGKNQVRLGGESPDISRYEDDIIHGFNITYQWFVENHRQVMEMIQRREGGLYSRYISGATQFFGMGVGASIHPQLLVEKDGRRKYLDKITCGRQLGIWEMAALEEGDIPWFGRYLNDRNLYSGQEIICQDFFEYPLLEELKKRFEQLDCEDNILQQKVLQLSIRVFQDEKRWFNTTGDRIVDIKGSKSVSVRWSKERFLGAAKAIAEEIMCNAVWCGEKIFWLSVISEGEQTVIKPVDYYFYSGIGGIAVFFRRLCAVYPEYGEVSSTLEQMLFSYADKISDQEKEPDTQYTGMYCGEGSIAYTFQLLYQITKDDKYLSYAGKHLKSISKLSGMDRRFDLVYGNAGLVLILCRQYLYTKDSCFMEDAHRTLDVLERNLRESEGGVVWNEEESESSVCGIAHGNSGFLMAYARMNSIMPGPKYLKRMRQIVSYENRFYDERTGNWADLRKKGEEVYLTFAWCNGALGALYARMWAAKWNPEEEWLKEEVKKAISLCGNLRIREGMCLCHGNMGNYLIMREISEYLDDAKMRELVATFHDVLLLEVEKERMPKIVQEKYNMGLMNGLTGIALKFVDYMV